MLCVVNVICALSLKEKRKPGSEWQGDYGGMERSFYLSAHHFVPGTLLGS